ncbi:MAG: hypothetical protein V7K50_28390 [Nostoc sp.]|uniref:hypothetical protein n=1 Tax=Nostoc sp. TaxID=1180 RepID=UPI002FFD3366
MIGLDTNILVRYLTKDDDIAFPDLVRYTRRGTALPCPYTLRYNVVPHLNGNRYKQYEQAAEIIEGGEQCFVANIVICELVWVLRSNTYQFSREEISKLLRL